MTPRILIIAGSDSGGGAGIQADIKTVTMLGGHAMTAITAITAQNTLGVQAAMPVPTDMVMAQIASCMDDIGVDAVKIGMLGSAETARAVAGWLGTLTSSSPPRLALSSPRRRGPISDTLNTNHDGEMGPRFRGDDGRTIPVVFDPVMIATSGDALADASTIAAFERLMRRASVVTPNLPELEALGGEAAVLAHGCHLVVKGGHASGSRVIDRLLSPFGPLRELEGKRFDTDDTHGTGCTFASALATGLASGLGIEDAFTQAVRFVRIAILSAPGLGQGHGPLGHALGMVPFDELEG